MTSKTRGVATFTCDFAGCKCDEKFIGKRVLEAKQKALKAGWVILQRKGILKHFCCQVHYEMDKASRQIDG